MNRVLVFTRFERFWHWTQAALIIVMMVTGFETNGNYTLFGYEQASEIHRFAAWALIGLWVFAIFWHIVTGQWRHYIPTADKFGAVMRYYALGIFDPSIPHPYKRTLQRKHNPLQRLGYLAFGVIIMPLIWISGLLYMFYNDWPMLGLAGLSLGLIALVHTAAAFLVLCFLLGHVYMIFTGTPVTGHLKSMITGYADEEEESVQETGDSVAAQH